MKRVVLITQHYLESKRKGGFHWLADAYWRAGWEVIFVTSYLSWLSFLRGNRRFPYNVLWRCLLEARRLRWIKPRLASYIWLTPWHPVNFSYFGLDFLSHVTARWFRRYGELSLGEIEPYLKETSLFIFESTPGLLLFDRFKRLNPEARYVYRVSDDLRSLDASLVVLEAEGLYAPKCDLVSAPTRYIYERFSHLPNSALHYHGLNKEVYDRSYPDPYTGEQVNLLFVGVRFLDNDFLDRASRLFPDWSFHIIGPIRDSPKRVNITAYGELPFSETVPYVKHADVGLSTLVYVPGAESWTDILKIIQYTYCRLPIVAPEFLRSSRRNMFYYCPGDDESIHSALVEAVNFDRNKVSTEGIYSWSELAETLAGELWEMRPL